MNAMKVSLLLCLIGSILIAGSLIALAVTRDDWGIIAQELPMVALSIVSVTFGLLVSRKATEYFKEKK